MADWTVVAEALDDAQLARAVALLTAEEIEHRVKGDTIEVPAELEADAVAILAALHDALDTGPDQVADFADCTARVSEEPMAGFVAQTTVMLLNSKGIRATTDTPGGIGTSEVHFMPQCYVLVRPEDVAAAREALGEVAAKLVGPESAGGDGEPEPSDMPAQGAGLEPSTQASLVLFAVLAIFAFLIMRSCK